MLVGQRSRVQFAFHVVGFGHREFCSQVEDAPRSGSLGKRALASLA